jgi:Cd2+/Zn2+-exporting ATPase
MTKYIFVLRNLTCAGCAAEIERELRTTDGIAGVILDFLGRELTLFVNHSTLDKEVLPLVRQIVKKVEPDVEVETVSRREKEYRFRDSIIDSFRTREMLLTLCGFILFLLTFTGYFSEYRIFIYLASYLLIGRFVLQGALRKFFSRYIFNEHFLMTVATIGAFAIGEYAEAVAVMLFYQIGRFFESKIVEYSQHSILEMQKLKPEYANLMRENKTVKVLPEQVKTGELIIVKPGERIPLDGVVISGISDINNALLSGESLPLPVSRGVRVSAGAVNLYGTLTIEVEKEYDNSTISRLIDLIRNAKSRKTVTERFITRFAAIYTPIVLVLAVLIAVVPPFILSAGSFQTWFYRSLIFLVISCPCALVISVPLSFFAGLTVFIRNGVLVKGGIFLENIARTKTIILDKTGTLTRGKLEVAGLKPAENVSEDYLLWHAYRAEAHSNHPLALAVIAEYHRQMSTHGNNGILEQSSLTYRETPGKGITAVNDNSEIIAGSPEFLRDEGISIPDGFSDPGQGRRMILVALNNSLLGGVEFSDSIREKIPQMIKRIKSFRIRRVLILTGDREDIAGRVASGLGINEYYADLLPQDKLAIIERIKKETPGKILYVGDGINDAPSMALADTGMAMGGIGSPAAIEAADIVLQTDEIEKLPAIFNIAKKTMNNARQNIILALSIKVLFLGLGAAGLITIWGAVFADVGVTILAVMNALRLLHYRKSFN